MFNTKTIFAAMSVAVVFAGIGVTTASAQEGGYRRGGFERFEAPHRFGPRCQYRVQASGTTELRPFGGGFSKERAQRRAIEHWSHEVVQAFGPRFANWDAARDKNVSCDRQGLELRCVASAHPCGGGGRF